MTAGMYSVVTVDATKAPYHADNTGKTDATQAIQQAINRCQTNYGGGIVFLPKGTYKVSDVLNVKQHVILKGEYQSPVRRRGIMERSSRRTPPNRYSR